MIIPLHKYLIFGTSDNLDRFFTLAQKSGFLEFVGLSHKKSLELPEYAKKLMTAMKIAKQHTIHPQEAPYLEPDLLAEKLIELQQEKEKLLEEQRTTHAEIARVAPFGSFSMDEVKQLEKDAKRVVQFFCMKSDIARETVLPGEFLFIGTEYDLDYFIGIHHEKVTYPKMIEMQVDCSVEELRKRLILFREKLLKIEADLRYYSNALSLLEGAFTAYLNQYHLDLAKHDASHTLESSLFAVEAWVPKNKVKALYGVLSHLNVHCEEVRIEPTDKVPTCMENRGVAKLGEDLVHVYDTPNPTDRDPSLWVLASFALFFAMIIADAGYGCIYLLFGCFLKWKFGSKNAIIHRFTKLIFIVSTSCIIWGIATASFFGIEIGPNHVFRKSSFIHSLAQQKALYHMAAQDDVYQEYVAQFPAVQTAQDGHDFLVKASVEREGVLKYEAQEEFYDNILMELSLLIGVIHLSLSCLRYMTRNFANAGWVVFMIGGYLYFPNYLDATSFVHVMGWFSKPLSMVLGMQLLWAGLGIVFVASLLQGKRWMAFHELTNGIQVFSDVLSYLRLYALALAGMVMASTFNEMGTSVGLIGGFFILLIGHTINMTLSVMAGAIHGLRLNFLEWYRYSFEGGGRLFNPLRLRKIK